MKTFDEYKFDSLNEDELLTEISLGKISSTVLMGRLLGQINQLKDKWIGDEIWISHRILNYEGVCTLDDMTLEDISTELHRPVKVGEDSFKELLNGIKDV